MRKFIEPHDSPPTGIFPPLNDVHEALQRRLKKETQGEVYFDGATRGRYSTDASIYQITPVGVFVPSTDDDVATALQIARELHVPVLPRGGGTSQCGQTVGAALVLDNTKYQRRVLETDVSGRTATVQPGIVLDHLNAHLKPHGLWFPVDVSTSAQATIGGMAGNNSCGSRSIAYGNMVHNVMGVTAWLSDGESVDFGPVSGLTGRAAQIGNFVEALALEHADEIDARWPKVMRRVAGYNLDIFRNQSERPYTRDGSVNLAHLLIGSEGTLAYSRSLKLQLSELPRHKVLGVINFPTFRAAMDSAQYIVKLGPTAVELVDRTMIELSLANPAFRPTIEKALIGMPAAILLVEFSGAEKNLLLPKLRQLVELMGDLGLPGSVVEMPDEAPQKNLWEVRKAGLNIMMSLKGDGKPVSFIEDCAVPLESLADYTDGLTEVFAKYGTRGTWYAHASVGTLHVRPILDMRKDGAQRMRAIAEEASLLVRKYKGAFSGEHGDGICRGEWIQWQFGPRINEALRKIKNEIDPEGLFNPSKIIDPPKMDDVSLMRFPPPSAPRPYKRIAINTVLDWSKWNVNADPVTEETTAPGTGGDTTGGFAKAVEMCNNNGHCRNFDAGTMCPSYRVTRDEQHLTRGRANTLRLAVSGQLGPDAFTSEAMYETMDLCVGCKGCKRDCPTGVDMAKMKVEFLAHYKGRHGHTLKDLIVGRLPDYAHVASSVPWLMNLRDILPGGAWLSEKLLDFSAKRTLPKWRKDTFWRVMDSRLFSTREEVLRVVADGGRAAVLFVDTFNGTFESENALAAARVLHAAGYALHTVTKSGGHHCCGRTFLSVGMVAEAKIRVGALIDALVPFADAGIAIVGLEPSCLLTLRDEALSMGLGKKAETVGSRALLFEEFVAREVKQGRFALDLNTTEREILLHGHCHQKAFDAVSPIMEVLKLIPGANPRLIESSCCGMAGSFGYEASHYEVSMQMAEASLLPAIRSAGNAILVADGTSCRHQIMDGAQREAVHVARLLDGLIVRDFPTTSRV
ncbi:MULTISPECIES: FAD-binding and (Fe-S)-binding domain-containing protein [unclassified Variovorax]|uniref:FAD-binding and (Fe-S)-binding domain-containing protein n=1 Tax=unclassified Variovorax TaxID=663243 RepID=UPI0008D735BA|nr:MULTISPECIES: FAD-binding and (Fe-S)-binding domain-containing protein [unclassified Variovorax]SEJ48756.1 FAD/FMN-containing dehydrogenase [Variovorax sp. OK202]SFC50150.1 FAD/FMN-containing dehydrogenase [Variovorax sp. OK212]